MAFDFPASPVTDQEYASPGGPVYVWQPPVWKRKGTGGGSGGGAATSIGDTPPATPINGQLWWESDSGITYIWYDDGDTEQWVQLSTVASTADYVKKNGDTMTGLLTLSGNPVSPLDAAPKQYVDAAGGGGGPNPLHVLKAGDTMTGALSLPGDPASTWQAATKNYVDKRVQKSGDTMTGHLTLYANPINALHASPKQYVDNFVSKDGSTMIGDLVIRKASPQVILDTTGTGQQDTVRFRELTKERWAFAKSGTAEGGSNTGSYFQLIRYADDGTNLGAIIQFFRHYDYIDLVKGQLKFPVAPNASTDPNVLDEYEEGTFVPTLSFGGISVGITYAIREGFYIKVGSMVYWSVHLYLSSKGTATGQPAIQGMPFQAIANLGWQAGNIGFLAPVTGIIFPGIMVAAGTTYASFFSNGAGMTDASFSNNTDVYVGGSYIAT